MRRRVALLVWFLGLSAAQAEERPDLTGLAEISLHSGVNHISAEGRPGLVVKGWRENGNAHGFHVYTALLQAADGQWQHLSFFAGNDERLELTDAPHTFEDVVRSVRFFKAKLNGKAKTVVVVAQRRMGGGRSIPEASPVDFTLYALRTRPDGEITGPDHYFDQIAQWSATGRFCHADTALAVELGLPPPADWPASNPSGCPQGRISLNRHART